MGRMRSIEVRLGETRVKAAVEPQDTLLELLRQKLGRTGAKEGCGQGECGACTVLVDGRAVYSCSVLALEADGRNVTTIEEQGDPLLSALKESFLEEDALQCGFCIPGQILAARALLAMVPRPSADQVRDALSGNLCRCGCYVKIVQAVQRAADRVPGKMTRVKMAPGAARRDACPHERGAAVPDTGETVETKVTIEGRSHTVKARKEPALPPWEGTSSVGLPEPRADGRAKVEGQARYAHDALPAGGLFARALRSGHARGRVVSMNVEAARRVPGVVAVLTPDDVKGITVDGRDLLTRTVRHAGEELAAVAGVDEAAVEAGLRALAPEVDRGRPVIGLKGKIADDPEVYERGDPAAAMARAEVVIEQRYGTDATQHACMETHGCVAWWEGDDLVVHESTQGVFWVRNTLMRALGLPAARIRVRCPYMGGGFGSKGAGDKHTVLAALLARDTGRPVRMMLPRADDFTAAWYRPESEQRLKLGATRAGKLLAIEVEADNPVSIQEAGRYAGHSTGPVQEYYPCAVRAVNRAILNNLPPPAAFRAPGHVQGTFALEQAVDELARSLRLDPLDVRLANLTDADPVSGKKYAGPGLKRCLEAGAEAFGWRSRPRPDLSISKGPIRRGSGLAIGVWSAGGGPPATAQVVV